MMKKWNLAGMSVDEMWQLYEEISRVLSVRLTSEKRELEKRLGQLRRENGPHLPESEGLSASNTTPSARRQYPPVFPKYQNPDDPSETWSGRGKQPRWLAAALKAGYKIEEFVIGNAEVGKNGGRP